METSLNIRQMSAYLKHHVLTAEEDAKGKGRESKYIDIWINECPREVELFGSQPGMPDFPILFRVNSC